MDCGLWDELNFPVGTRVLSNKLKAAGIAHDFELFPDGHPDVQYRNDVSLPRTRKSDHGVSSRRTLSRPT